MDYNLIRTGDILGKTVVDERGRRVGTVDDINLNPESWRVDGFLLSLDRDAAHSLGERSPMFGSAQINVRTSRIRSAGDVVILEGTLEHLADALRGARGEQPPR